MNSNEYAKLAKIETYYWWHVGRLSIIDTLLGLAAADQPQVILNIGSGTGGTVPALEAYGAVTNADTVSTAATFMKQRGYAVDIFDGKKLPYAANSFDIICAFDVLEHIDDQGAALKEWLRVLKPGGRLVLTVPAYQWLWSEHDEAMHHFRRYTRRRLAAVLKQSGKLEVQKTSYAFMFTLPLFGVARLLQRLLPQRQSAQSDFPSLPKLINTLLTMGVRFEARLLRKVNLPAGTSVLAVAKKIKKPA